MRPHSKLKEENTTLVLTVEASPEGRVEFFGSQLDNKVSDILKYLPEITDEIFQVLMKYERRATNYTARPGNRPLNIEDYRDDFK